MSEQVLLKNLLPVLILTNGRNAAMHAVVITGAFGTCIVIARNVILLKYKHCSNQLPSRISTLCACCAAIPATVVAAASFDDMIAITGYTIFIDIAVRPPSGNHVWQIMHGPVSVVLGILGGLLAAFLCSFTKLWNNNVKRCCVVVLAGTDNPLRATGTPALCHALPLPLPLAVSCACSCMLAQQLLPQYHWHIRRTVDGSDFAGLHISL